MQIGIFGGSFNPPHRGHLAVIEGCSSHLELDLLLLVPSGTPPHKQLPPHTPTKEERLGLLSQFLEIHLKETQNPCPVEISTLELEREGESYTIDTLKALKLQYPEGEFHLLMGEDMYLSFEQWRAPEEVLKDATLTAFCRGNTPPTQELVAQQQHLKSKYGVTSTLLSLPEGLPASSTEVRDLLPEQTDLLLPSTYGSILRAGLYGVRKSLVNLPLEELRACALSMLRAKRIPHVLGVEEECEKLALRWGVDPNLARRAGILHDCTKFWSYDEHIAFCNQHNIALDPLEIETDKLLHAKSGGGVAREIFGETQEVCSAVFCHTTGKKDMTTLDKILYIADYMEPNRDFPEVARLRTLAYEDLDSAMVYGLEITLQEMRTRGKITHPNTLEIHGQLTEKKENSHPC